MEHEHELRPKEEWGFWDGRAKDGEKTGGRVVACKNCPMKWYLGYPDIVSIESGEKTINDFKGSQ